MQKGADGNYHVPWVNEMMWNDLGFFDWGLDGSGRGGGNYTNIMGISSADTLRQMDFGESFGLNSSGEYGFWRSITFKPTD